MGKVKKSHVVVPTTLTIVPTPWGPVGKRVWTMPSNYSLLIGGYWKYPTHTSAKFPTSSYVQTKITLDLISAHDIDLVSAKEYLTKFLNRTHNLDFCASSFAPNLNPSWSWARNCLLLKLIVQKLLKISLIWPSVTHHCACLQASIRFEIYSERRTVRDWFSCFWGLSW